MLYKVRGVVIKFFKYKESSIIVQIFTDKFGLQSYIVNGVRSSRGHQKIALYQPLTMLDLVVYKNDKKDLQRISEATCHTPYHSIPDNIIKTSMALFISEFLSKSLREDSQSEQLFEFLINALGRLDLQKDNIENFHLSFLLKISSYFGFSPSSGTELMTFISKDLVNWDSEDIETLDNLISVDFFTKMSLSRIHRKKLLNILLIFFDVHFERNATYKSVAVLNDVLQ